LSHQWPDEQAPAECTPPLKLKQCAYHLIVEYVQPQPTVDRSEDVCPQTTGFQIKYARPDSYDRIIAIPLEKFFRDWKDNTLADLIAIEGAAKRFLELHFTSPYGISDEPISELSKHFYLPTVSTYR
jgi:hypothetical protein